MTTQPATFTPHPLEGRQYNLYEPHETEEQARAAFVRRHGVEPEIVFHMYGDAREWWAGPVPRQDAPGLEKA